MSGQFPSQHPPGTFPAGNPFAEQVNPYAAPQAAGYQPNLPGVGNSPFAGLWRQGHVLVMHKAAPLPDICLLSNQPATRRLKRTMNWHHPATGSPYSSSADLHHSRVVSQKTATLHLATDEWRLPPPANVAGGSTVLWGLLLASALP
jgi:hypothetical protein